MLYVTDFGRERHFFDNYTYSEFKEIVNDTVHELEKHRENTYSNLKGYSPGYFLASLSGVNDKFVAIENIDIVEEDIHYLYQQKKRYLLITSTLYNSETNELLDINDELHQPKMIQTNNPSRPAFFFCESTTDLAQNLKEELSLFLTSDEIANSKESHIKEEIDSIFAEYRQVSGLLIHDNVFYGNFKRHNISQPKYQQFIFSI